MSQPTPTATWFLEAAKPYTYEIGDIVTRRHKRDIPGEIGEIVERGLWRRPNGDLYPRYRVYWRGERRRSWVQECDLTRVEVEGQQQ